jgi:competence protein ComEC
MEMKRIDFGKGIRIAAAIAAAASAGMAGIAVAATLDIYFIDVEGGQSTLVIMPNGETLLIDAGFPSDGRFESKPGDPGNARDAQRIAAAAKDAGVSRIDYLLVTHFHPDHVGGVPELSQLIPIGTFIDHDTVSPNAGKQVPGTLDAFDAYKRVREHGKHLVPAVGDRLPLKGVEATVVSSAGATLAGALPGGGARNAACSTAAPALRDPYENPRSTGVLIRYGEFRFLDIGDLSGQPLRDLVCPSNRIGPVDVYLVAHHGGADAADPATFAAFRPRVAILDNGAKKGGAASIFATLRAAAGLEDVWQVDRSEAEGAENFDAERIANLDEQTAHWIKLSANSDGSFRVLNARTGAWQSYSIRH